MATSKLQLPGGLRVVNGVPDIAKYWNNNDTAYTSTAQVLSEIPIGIRHTGLKVQVLTQEYWWPTTGGVTDVELVVYTVGGGGGGSYTSNNGITLTASNFKLGGTLDQHTTITLSTFDFGISSATSNFTITDTIINNQVGSSFWSLDANSQINSPLVDFNISTANVVINADLGLIINIVSNPGTTGQVLGSDGLGSVIWVDTNVITNGNGTTVNGTAIDWGGFLTDTVVLDGLGSYGVYLGYPTGRIGAFAVDSTTGVSLIVNDGFTDNELVINAIQFKFNGKTTSDILFDNINGVLINTSAGDTIINNISGTTTNKFNTLDLLHTQAVRETAVGTFDHKIVESRKRQKTTGSTAASMYSPGHLYNTNSFGISSELYITGTTAIDENPIAGLKTATSGLEIAVRDTYMPSAQSSFFKNSIITEFYLRNNRAGGGSAGPSSTFLPYMTFGDDGALGVAPSIISLHEFASTVTFFKDLSSSTKNYVTIKESGFLELNNLKFNTIPSQDDALTRILVVDNATGTVKYRDVASISGGGGSGDMLLGTIQTVTALKTFQNSTFAINNPANTFKYNIVGGAIVADRVATIPVLIGSDTFVMESLTQTLTNKSIGATNVIGGVTMTLGSDASNDLYYRNASGVLTRLANGTTGQYLAATTGAAPSWATPAGAGDMVLATAQTNTGAKTFLDTTFLLRNVANTFNGSFVNTNTANRIYTLKDSNGTIAFTSDITGTNSGTNTGDNAVNSLYSGLVSNATHTGDATGSTALTVVRINGQSLAALATGILKNTTTTGVPSIAVAGDFPTLNQNTTGSAATLTTARTINGVSFNGSANITIPAYATVQVDSTPLTQRTVLNFTGSVNAVDDAGNTRTNVFLSSTLEAFAAYNTDGFLVQTSADVYVGRTIVGTTNKIVVTDGDAQIGNPVINVGTDIVDKTASNTYTAGQTQIFTANGTNAGLRIVSVAGNPSTPISGDIWNNTTDLDLYTYINGQPVALTRSIIEDVSATTYTFTEADRTKIKRFTHASGCTANIPTGLSLNWTCTVYRDSAGVLTITSSGTLQGAGTTLDTNQTAATIHHRGTNIHMLLGAVGAAGGGSGDMLLGTVQTVTALKTFNTGTFALNNPANTFKYNFLGSAIAADRTVTLPLLTGSDVFTMNDFAQTLTNKTLGTGTVFSVIPTINDGITFTFNPSATVAGVNIGSHTAAPSGLNNFDIWGDSVLLDFYGRINGVTTALTRQVWEDVTGTTYSFVEADRNKIKRFTNVSGCTATIPAGLSNFWQVTLWRDAVAGVITIASSGTLESAGTTMDTPKTYATVLHRGSNIHSVGGAIGSSGGSGITRSITVTSGSATMGATALTDYVYLVAALHTMTLPTAVGNINRYTIKNNHSVNITVNTTSSQTIDGTTTISIGPQSSVDIISNNTNWNII